MEKCYRVHVQHKKNLEFRKMIKDNIEIQFVTEKPENLKRKFKSTKDRFLPKSSNVKIRYITVPPQAHLLIIDQKEVFIRISPKSSFSESPVLRSNNPCILTIAQSYFEKMWNESVSPDDNRKIQVDE